VGERGWIPDRCLTAPAERNIIVLVDERREMSLAEIAERKQALRDRDAQEFAAGDVSIEDLRRRNAILAPLGVLRVREGSKRLR
jgi:hypothetical protein